MASPLLTTRSTFIVQRIADDLRRLHSSEFERVAADLVELIRGVILLRKGQTLKGQSRAVDVDGVDQQEKVVVEAGVEETYFDHLKKPDDTGMILSKKIRKDIDHALSQHPNFEALFLCTSQTMPQDNLRIIREEITRKWGAAIASKIEIYDVESVASELHKQLQDRPWKVSRFSSDIESLAGFTFSHNPPMPVRHYVTRPTCEAQLEESIKNGGVTMVTGISGVGKSEIAKAVISNMQDHWDTVIWVRPDYSNPIIDLHSIPVTSLGNSRSILNTIASDEHKTLLVIDGILNDPAAIVRSFDEHRGSGASLLIISEVAYLDTAVSQTIRIAGLNRDEVETLFDQVRAGDNSQLADAFVDATPALIVFYGRLIAMGEISPEEALKDIKNPHSVVAESGQTLGDELLRKHGYILSNIVGPLRFFGGRLIEKNLFRELLPSYSVWQALVARSLVTDEGNGWYKVNAVVHSYVSREYSGKPEEPSYAEKFWLYLSEYRGSRPPHFLRNLHVFRKRIRDAFWEESNLGIATRFYLEIEDGEPDAAAVDRIRDRVRNFSENPYNTEDITIECWFEAVERLDVRLADEEKDTFLSQAIVVSEMLVAEKNTPYTRFHLAKLKSWIGEKAQALAVFEMLMQERCAEIPQEKILLQIVSIYLDCPTWERKHDIVETLRNIMSSDASSLRIKFGVLERARRTPETRVLIRENIEFINDVLRNDLSTAFIQPLANLEWIMSKVRWEDPELTLFLLSNINWQLIDQKEPELRRWLGRIRLQAAKRKGILPDAKCRELQEALADFEFGGEARGEHLRFYIETLFELGQNLRVIEAIKSATNAEKGVFFHYTCAKFWCSYGDRDRAMDDIQQGRRKMSQRVMRKFGHLFDDLEKKMATPAPVAHE